MVAKTHSTFESAGSTRTFKPSELPMRLVPTAKAPSPAAMITPKAPVTSIEVLHSSKSLSSGGQYKALQIAKSGCKSHMLPEISQLEKRWGLRWWGKRSRPCQQPSWNRVHGVDSCDWMVAAPNDAAEEAITEPDLWRITENRSTCNQVLNIPRVLAFFASD